MPCGVCGARVHHPLGVLFFSRPAVFRVILWQTTKIHANNVLNHFKSTQLHHSRTATARRPCSHQDGLEEIRLPLRQLAVLRDGNHGYGYRSPFFLSLLPSLPLVLFHPLLPPRNRRIRLRSGALFSTLKKHRKSTQPSLTWQSCTTLKDREQTKKKRKKRRSPLGGKTP